MGLILEQGVPEELLNVLAWLNTLREWPNIILPGGLQETNVEQAVVQVGPMVDVSTGV